MNYFIYIFLHFIRKNIHLNMSQLFLRIILSFILLNSSYWVTINSIVEKSLMYYIYKLGIIGTISYCIYDTYKLYKKSKLIFSSLLHHIGAFLIVIYAFWITPNFYLEKEFINSALVIYYMSRMIILNSIVLYTRDKLIMLFLIPFHIQGLIQCLILKWDNKLIEWYYLFSLLILIPENVQKISNILNRK